MQGDFLLVLHFEANNFYLVLKTLRTPRILWVSGTELMVPRADWPVITQGKSNTTLTWTNPKPTVCFLSNDFQHCTKWLFKQGNTVLLCACISVYTCAHTHTQNPTMVSSNTYNKKHIVYRGLECTKLILIL